MFLDGQLRRLDARKQRIVIRGDLGRRLMGLECSLAKAAALRSFANWRVVWTVAEQIIDFLRKR